LIIPLSLRSKVNTGTECIGSRRVALRFPLIEK
jgi:hypothetical protein